MTRDERRDISYADKLSTLFPDEQPREEMKIGANFTRDITFQVTEACNMACTYCYQHNKTPDSMSFETGRKFIDLILASDERTSCYIKSRECPGCVIDFIGGEPLLEIDLIDQLTEYMIFEMIRLNHPWATRFIISIGTNGLLYFTDKVQRYIRKYMGKIGINITVDGNRDIHDMCRLDLNGNPTYDRAFAAAKDWDHRIGVGRGSTKITLAPTNVHMASSAVISMMQNGYENIHINCVYEEGWQLEHAKILYSELKKLTDFILEHPKYITNSISILNTAICQPASDSDLDQTYCGGLGLMLSLAPNGFIYPCLRYAPSSNPDTIKLIHIGHVDHGIGITAEEKQNIEMMRNVSMKSQYHGTQCENCPISTGCGNCPGYGYEVTGIIGARTTYHCIMHQARSLAIAYHTFKLLQTGYSDITRPHKLYCPKEWAIPIIGAGEYEYLKKMEMEVIKE